MKEYLALRDSRLYEKEGEAMKVASPSFFFSCSHILNLFLQKFA